MHTQIPEIEEIERKWRSFRRDSPLVVRGLAVIRPVVSTIRGAAAVVYRRYSQQYLQSPRTPNRREYLHASMGERHSAIASIGNLKAADIRAKAMLLLFSIYELRSVEVRRLMLEDIDWRSVEAGCVSFDMPLLSSESNSGIEKRDEH